MYFKHETAKSYTDWQHPMVIWQRKAIWQKQKPIYRNTQLFVELGFFSKLLLWLKGKLW
jgi:hypothetical protein